VAAVRKRQRRWRPRRDWGRAFAVVLCAAFAVVGAVPLGLGLLVRTGPVRAWAARQTSALIAEKLGVAARYDVIVQAWPMVVALENVVVDASDGGGPFLSVERVAVRPRPFSLLAGRLDAGDVEVVGPRVRAVVDGGVVKNLHYNLPPTDAGGGGPPVASLSITDARIDAMVDGVRVAAREVDLDVSAEDQGAFEVALRAGQTNVTRVRAFPGRPDEDAVDDDVICRAEARVRVQGRSLLVRRLLLEGSADFDPDPGTRPSCALRETDWRAVEVRLGALRVDLPEREPPRVSGRVHARVPAALVHRFKDVAHATGSITADLEVDYDGASPLPHVSGHVSADRPGIDGKIFGKRIDLDVAVGGTTVSASNVVSHWADGTVTIPQVTIEPFAEGVPIRTGPVSVEGLELHALLRDLGAHPQAYVAWTLEKGRFESLKGHLDPPFIEGPLTMQTHGFEIFNRPVVDPLRAHLMGVKEGTVRCNFVINGRKRSPYKFPGIVIANAAIDTPRSHLDATVTLGFNSVIDIDLREGSRVDLAEISPLGDIPIAGVASLRVNGRGPFEHPKIAGELKITDFAFAGLPIGDLESPRVAFVPMVLDLGDLRLRHGQSRVRAPSVRLAFDKGATVIADADLDTTEAPGLRVRDLFEVFHFEKDPRFAEVEGTARGKAHVHYALGGREDHCGGGLLDVQASMNLEEVGLFGERFDGGTVDAGVLWDDALAGTAGMRIDLRSATLRKGEGSILVGASVRHGGFIRGNAVGSGLPVSRVDAFGAAGKLFDGTASLVAEIGGTLSALELGADVSVSRLRIGPAALGPSHLRVAMTAAPDAPARGRTVCGNPRAAPFDPAEIERDLSSGDIKVDGALFDGQLALDDLRISRQRHKVLRGQVTAKKLDLGTLANLVPGVAFTGSAPGGSLSATLDVKSLPLASPQLAKLALVIEALDVQRDGASARLLGKTPSITLAGDELTVPDVKLQLRSASGFTATVVADGAVHRVATAPDLDVGVHLEPVDLSRLSADIPSVDHAAGTLKAKLRVLGPVAALRYAGSVELSHGELALKGAPVGVSNIEVAIDVADGDARLTRAEARIGGGAVRVSGRMPLRGPEAGAFSVHVTAAGVKLPVSDGVNLTADANLDASYRPGASGERGQRNVPDVKGTVELTQFSYTRPIALNLSLSQLGRAPRTNVDTYDPANDFVRFNVNLISPRPLRFTNNLIDMDLEVMSPGLVLSGTNQRFGARGLLRILPDSKLQLRSNEFLVREGYVRFDDPLKIVPKVDLRAQTEYRRYTSSAEQPGAAAASSSDSGGPSGAPSSPVSAAASTSAAGVWRITLQARGEADNLKVALSSDPPLSQEDIVLLLTLGMTRAEIDRGATAALGQSVGLEALSALTGADKAVKTIVPLIDEFRFGTGYSSRTASPEPTVTVGKRITESVRASVTTGLSEDREVRSNVEWRLNRHVSVQGSYDNLNDVSSSPVGNLGVDLRWRLEFE
jgi:translocation and assembly module TamB